MNLPPLRGDEVIGPDRRHFRGDKRSGKPWNRLRRWGMRLGWIAVAGAVPTITASGALGIYAGVTLPGRVAALQRARVRDSVERALILAKIDRQGTVVFWQARLTCDKLGREARLASAIPCGLAAHEDPNIYPVESEPRQ